MKKEKIMKNIVKVAVLCMFIIYLLCLANLLFFSSEYGRTVADEYRYNLTLFREIKRSIHLFTIGNYMYGILNLGGNIVAFMPFGFLLPILRDDKKHTLWTMLWKSFLLSLGAEVIQFISKTGTFDVDDLILNTIGGALGYLCYWLLIKRGKQRGEKKNEG